MGATPIEQLRTLEGIHAYLEANKEEIEISVLNHIVKTLFYDEPEIPADFQEKLYFKVAERLSALSGQKAFFLLEDMVNDRFTFSELRKEARRILVMRHIATHIHRVPVKKAVASL